MITQTGPASYYALGRVYPRQRVRENPVRLADRSPFLPFLTMAPSGGGGTAASKNLTLGIRLGLG